MNNTIDKTYTWGSRTIIGGHAAAHLIPAAGLISTQYQGALHEATHSPVMGATMAAVVGLYAVKDYLQARKQSINTLKEKVTAGVMYAGMAAHIGMHSIPLTPKQCAPQFHPMAPEQCYYTLPGVQAVSDFAHTIPGTILAIGTMGGFFVYEHLRDRAYKKRSSLETITEELSHQNV